MLSVQGTGRTPWFISSDDTTAAAMPHAKVPPTTTARRRYPLCQAVRVASSTNRRNKIPDAWVRFVQGFFSPIGDATVSPQAAIWCRSVIARKFRFGSRMNCKARMTTRMPVISQASQRGPACR